MFGIIKPKSAVLFRPCIIFISFFSVLVEFFECHLELVSSSVNYILITFISRSFQHQSCLTLFYLPVFVSFYLSG